MLIFYDTFCTVLKGKGSLDKYQEKKKGKTEKWFSCVNYTMRENFLWLLKVDKKNISLKERSALNYKYDTNIEQLPCVT